MKKLILCSLAFAITLGTTAFAGKDYKEFKQPVEEDLFKDTELQVDVFGSYGYGENERRTKTVRTHTTDVTRDPLAVAPPQTQPEIRPQFRTTVTTRVENGQLVTTTTTRHERKVTTGHTGLFDQDNAFGGGIGANYFFARYLGVGLEGDWLAGGEAIHLIDGNVFARYPINVTLFGARRGIAPYIFGGYGAKFDGTKWGVGHAGAGVEFRFCKEIAWFTDGRFVFGHADAEAGIFRTGLRVIF